MPTATEEDVAAARLGSADLRNQLAQQQGRPAPVAQAVAVQPPQGAQQVQVGPAAQAGPVNLAPAAQTHAAQTAVPGAVTAAPVAHAPNVVGQQVSSATVGPVHDAEAARAAAAAGQAVNANAARVDTSGQALAQWQQQTLNQALMAQAQGRGGPSAAEAQLGQGIDRAIAAQRALAAGARGTGRVSAGLTAATNVAGLTQDAARQAAILRAQEQQQAQGLATQALGATRGQDIGLATTQAGLEQQAGLQNASLGTQANLQNADLATRANLQNAALATQVSQGNAQAANVAGLKQADLSQGAMLANQDADLRGQLANQGVASAANLADASNSLAANQGNQRVAAEVGISNTGQQNTVQLANAAAQDRMAQLKAQIDSQQGIANASQQNEMATLQAQLTQQTNLANTAAQNAANTTNATLGTNVALSNQDAILKQEGLDDNQKATLLQALAQQQGQVLGWDQAAAQVAEEKRKNTLGFVGGLISGAGQVGAAAAGAP